MKNILRILVLVLFTGVCSAQAVFVEEFNYAVGSLLTANGWTLSSGTINAIAVTSPGLTFAGYPSVAGNAVTLTTTGEDDYKSFTPITSGTVYASFMINVQSAQATGDYFIALSQSTSQTNYYVRTHIKSSGNGFLIGLSKSNELGGGYVYGTTVLAFNTTYVIIIKHTLAAGDMNDPEQVFVLSSTIPATEPSTSEIGPYVETTKNDPVDLSTVTIRQGSTTAAPALRIDGIRVAASWGALFITTDVNDEVAIPTSYSLSQNYPNPFNPSTVIKYQVPQNSFVNINVYDVLGSQVKTLVREEKAAGSYELKFDASNMPSGVYFYSIQTGAFTQTKKMILMK